MGEPIKAFYRGGWKEGLGLVISALNKVTAGRNNDTPIKVGY